MNKCTLAKTIYTLLLLFLLLSACSKESERALLDRAGTYLQSDPDSTLCLLQQIHYPELLEGKDQADYWYLHATSRRNTGRSYVTDSLLRTSIDYYAATGDSSRLRDCYRLEAQRQEWLKQTDPADSLYRAAIAACPQHEQRHIPSLYDKLTRLHIDHINSKNYPKARQYALMLLSVTDDPDWRMGAYYELAVSYNFEGLCPDSAVYYTHKCLELVYQMPLENRPFLLQNCANMIGLDAGEALRLSDEAIAIDPDGYDYSSTITKGYIYLSIGKPDSAMQCCLRAMEAYRQEVVRSKEDHPTPHNALNTLYACASFALSPRDIRAKSFIYNDSIYSAAYQQGLINDEQAENQQNLLEKQFTLKLQQQQLRLWLITIVCTCMLASGLLYLYLRRRRRHWIASEERAESLKRLLDEAQRNTADRPAADGSFFRRILLKQLGLIRLLASSPTNANQELLRQINSLCEETRKEDSLLIWEELYPIIDASYNEFYTKLTKLYGGLLNEKEVQLCCLLCAGFSTKEINVVTRQSVSTIYHRKIDIRHKLKLDETRDLSDFILSLQTAKPE